MPMGVLRVGGPRAGHAMHKSWYAPARRPSYLATADRMTQTACATSDVKMWAVATDLPDAHGADASAWTARIGSSLAQAVGAKRPEVDHRGLNGRAALQFATGEDMRSDPDYSGTDQMIVSVVCQCGDSSAIRDVICGTNAAARNFILGRPAINQAWAFRKPTFNYVSSPLGANPRAEALGVAYSTTGAISTGQAIYGDGELLSSVLTSGAIDEGDFGLSATMFLGMRYTAANYIEGPISEVYIAAGTSALAPALQQVQAAQRYRWGI